MFATGCKANDISRLIVQFNNCLILLLAVNHPCLKNNSGCSHICYLNEGQATCSCPKYRILGANKRTCECKCFSCIALLWVLRKSEYFT